MRLINANELRDRLQNLSYDDWNQGVSTSWAEAYSEIADMVDEMPTIEAEPVRHGKLMRTEAYPHNLYCGECYNTLIPNDEAVEQNWMLKPRYCMYCGAKLDEVKE